MSDKKITELIEEKRSERRTWQSVFCNSDGEAVLLALLNRLGYYSSDPSLIDPHSISHANWILNQIGIVSPQNLPRLGNAIAASASFLDIDALEKSLNEEGRDV
jgi:hypothetical protein